MSDAVATYWTTVALIVGAVFFAVAVLVGVFGLLERHHLAWARRNQATPAAPLVAVQDDTQPGGQS